MLLDISINDEGIPDTPPAVIDGDWTVFVQDADGYLAEVTIAPTTDATMLATKLRDLVDDIAAEDHPFF